MKIIFKKLVIASMLILLTNTAYASDSKSGVESLSKDLRALDDGMN